MLFTCKPEASCILFLKNGFKFCNVEFTLTAQMFAKGKCTVFYSDMNLTVIHSADQGTKQSCNH